MFTGIIETIGSISALESTGGDMRLHIHAEQMSYADVRLGDSIAVSGVCLTVIDFGDQKFSVDVSTESLRCTTLGNLKAGDRVNLEKALTPATRLGWHLVSGHVDGVGEVVSRVTEGRSVRFRFRTPEALSRYIAGKGSICIDGISLTVNSVEGREFDVSIVPHTLSNTTLDEFQAGRRFNLEVDIISRYLERLIKSEKEFDSNSAYLGLLRRQGFLD